MNERPHVTSERPLEGGLQTYELMSVVRTLRSEREYVEGTHDAMTLAKSRGLRVVLIVMKAQAELPENTTEGALSLHVLDGALEVHAGPDRARVGAGELVTVPAEVPYRLRALAESAILLTLAYEPAVQNDD
jgi:quercetin dioxygenase-like cupin family protein